MKFEKIIIIESVILSLEEDLSSTLNWFRVNHMAAYPGTFQPKLTLEINDITIPLID